MVRDGQRRAKTRFLDTKQGRGSAGHSNTRFILHIHTCMLRMQPKSMVTTSDQEIECLEEDIECTHLTGCSQIGETNDGHCERGSSQEISLCPSSPLYKEKLAESTGTGAYSNNSQ
ncbi:hypothetical protein H2248_010463 [Termitomyces sp. 'cryptogamus']|nr:hypothetical protein H2248_010463 [Termitomyces sp. 'cryptogamus']